MNRKHGVQVKIGEVVDGTFPVPSQETVDSWFRQIGGVILGAIIAVGAALVGARIAATQSE